MRIYGPVPSRRFGLSLGVDLVPHKTCPFDCIYCQLGPTDKCQVTTKDFYSLDDILFDVENELSNGLLPDMLTFAGSGEPTLYRSLGALIDRLHDLADIPVLLITNSALLWQDEVAEAAIKADIIAPSLDGGKEAIFKQVNQPHPDISFDKMFEGLKTVTHAHPGQVHLEVMLIQGVNDDMGSLNDISSRLEHLKVDRIDINTPVRPPVPERHALPAGQDVLSRALRLFGPKSHAIGTFEKCQSNTTATVRSFSDLDKDISEMLARRPCTADDISASLGTPTEMVKASLDRLLTAGLVDRRSGQAGSYYHIPSHNPTIRDK